MIVLSDIIVTVKSKDCYDYQQIKQQPFHAKLYEMNVWKIIKADLYTPVALF